MRSKWLRGFLMAGIAACMLLTVALAGTFSVTLPTALPVSVDAEGNVTTAEPVIKNTGGMTVTVAAATVEPLDGWTIVPWGTDFGKLPVSSKKFAMQFYGSEVPADGVIKLPSQSTIPVGGSAAVVYDARIAVQSAAAEDLTIANCCIVVDSDEPEVPTGAVMAANSSWYKSSTPKASITEIELVDRYTPTGEETESWDASAAGDGSVMAYLNGTKLTLAGNGTGKIYANPDASLAFCDQTALGIMNGDIDMSEANLFFQLRHIYGLELLDTSLTTSMMGMFGGCASLQELDLSGFDTSGVENMQLAFGFCQSLNTLNLGSWDTNAVSNSENMIGMFYQSTIKSITLGEKFVFQAGGYEFFGCSEDIMWQEVGTEKNYTLAEFCALSREGEVTYSLWIFDGLAARDSWYKGSTSKSAITEIELVDRYTPTGEETESWDASAAGDGTITAYIYGAKLILAGDGSGKINANPNSSFAFSDYIEESEEADYFSSLTAISGLELLDTSQTRNMASMFYYCSSLQSLNLANFDTSRMDTMLYAFSGTRLQEITLGEKFTFIGDNAHGLGTDSVLWTDMNTGVSYLTSELPVCREKTTTYTAEYIAMLDANGTWCNGAIDRSTIIEIELVDSYTPTGAETESWDASAAGDGSVMAYLIDTKLVIAGNGTGRIYANESSIRTFSFFEALTQINGLDLLDTSRAKTLDMMFYYCPLLQSLNLTNFCTAQVRSMKNAFNKCDALTNLDLSSFDTTNTEQMEEMFPPNLKELTLGEKFVFSKDLTVANSGLPGYSSSALYSDCWWHDTQTNELLSLDDLLVSTRTSATTYVLKTKAVFGGFANVSTNTKSTITEIEFVDSYTPTGAEAKSWDASDGYVHRGSVTAYIIDTKLIVAGNGTGKIYASDNMWRAFYNFQQVVKIKGLELLDTSATTSFSQMFWKCYKLQSLDLSTFDTSSIEQIDGAFYDCWSLADLILYNWDVSRCWNGDSIFARCTSLTELDLSGWDTSKMSTFGSDPDHYDGYTTGMFTGCKSLKTIYVSEKWSVANATLPYSVFYGCTSLVGAIAYDEDKTDTTYANYETGYLTYKAASGTAQSLMDAELPTETVPEITEPVTDPVGEEPENDTPAGTVTEIEPLPEETQEDAAPADDQDEKAAEPPDEGGSTTAGIILTLALPAVWKGVLYGKTK